MRDRKIIIDNTVPIIIVGIIYGVAFWFLADMLKHIIIFFMAASINITMLSQATIQSQKIDYVVNGRFILALMVNLALAYVCFIAIALFLIRYGFWG